MRQPVGVFFSQICLKNLVLAGDYKVVLTDAKIYSPAIGRDNALMATSASSLPSQ